MSGRVTMCVLALLGFIAPGARAGQSQTPAKGQEAPPAAVQSSVPLVADASEIPALEHEASAPELGGVLPRCVKCDSPVWPEGAPPLRFRLHVVVRQDGRVGTARIVQVLRGDPEARPVGPEGDVTPALRDSPTARAGQAVLAAARQWRLSNPGEGILLIVTDVGNDSGQSAAVAAPRAALKAGTDVPAPTKLVDVRPIYPPDAIKARISGQVVIEATIGPAGDVDLARVVRGVPELDDAALEAVRQWKFTSTLLNGQPVSVTMFTTVTFSLSVPVK